MQATAAHHLDAARQSRLRQSLTSPWPYLGAVVVLAWVLLLRHHGVAGHPARSDHADATTTVGMWVVMTVAMMVPTALPVLVSLRDISAAAGSRVWWAFLGAYLGIWLGFATAAATAQLVLIRHHVLGDDGASDARWFTAALLLLAGAYQLSALKQRCASECVHPMTFFWKHWRDGVGGGVRMGLRHGATCLGCCWALMLLAFVGGVTSIWFMVLSAAVMALEKLPRVGRFVTIPLAIALLLAGGVVALGPPADANPAHHPSNAAVDPARGTP